MCEVISLCSQPTCPNACDAEVTAKCFKSSLQWELEHTMALFLLDIVLPPRLFIVGTKISLVLKEMYIISPRSV